MTGFNTLLNDLVLIICDYYSNHQPLPPINCYWNNIGCSSLYWSRKQCVLEYPLPVLLQDLPPYVVHNVRKWKFNELPSRHIRNDVQYILQWQQCRDLTLILLSKFDSTLFTQWLQSIHHLTTLTLNLYNAPVIPSNVVITLPNLLHFRYHKLNLDHSTQALTLLLRAMPNLETLCLPIPTLYHYSLEDRDADLLQALSNLRHLHSFRGSLFRRIALTTNEIVTLSEAWRDIQTIECDCYLPLPLLVHCTKITTLHWNSPLDLCGLNLLSYLLDLDLHQSYTMDLTQYQSAFAHIPHLKRFSATVDCLELLQCVANSWKTLQYFNWSWSSVVVPNAESGAILSQCKYLTHIVLSERTVCLSRNTECIAEDLQQFIQQQQPQLKQVDISSSELNEPPFSPWATIHHQLSQTFIHISFHLSVQEQIVQL